jgi:catechol 2,3-dioxygenase-like lactoylglutathione lyase family enzyme
LVGVTTQRDRHVEPDAYRVRRIHHVGITVANLDRSLAFYRDLLGMRLIGLSVDEDVGAILGKQVAGVRIADLDVGNDQILELLEYGSENGDVRNYGPDAVGSCHLSLEVGDLTSVLSRLASAGFTPMGEPTPLTIGGVWEGCTVIYLRDPDGIILELLERDTGE